MDFGTSLIANCQSPEAVEPGKAAFDDPAMSAEFFRAFNTSSRNTRQDATPSTGFAAARVIIAFVAMAFFGPAERTSRLSRNGRNSVEHFFKHGTVVNIGTGQPYGERCAAPVRHQVTFCARLAAIRWIWARGRAPFFAGIDDESTQTRLKSIRLALRRRRSNSWCNRSHTPACCQSRRRRQQVTPDPQPSSGGKSSHAMPERRTKRIPLSAARSETRGLPPRGFGAGGGRSLSMIGQRPSGIKTEGIPLYESTIPRRTRVLKGALSEEIWRVVAMSGRIQSPGAQMDLGNAHSHARRRSDASNPD